MDSRWSLALGALFLGVLQGLTEFLPVSSSGHLVLFQQFFHVAGDHILFDLVLHVGTLVPVLWFYRDSFRTLITDPFVGEGAFLQRPGVRLLALLVLASIPTAAIGLAFEDTFELLFATPAALVVSFGFTGTILYASGKFGQGTTTIDQLSWKTALILGVAQGVAITPGVSRSGTTIAVALMLGVEREAAARMSFLMSVPAITGAVLLKLRDVETAGLDPLQLGVGGLAALISGYAALIFLVKIVRKGQFSRFAWYVWGAAIVAGIVAFMKS